MNKYMFYQKYLPTLIAVEEMLEDYAGRLEDEPSVSMGEINRVYKARDAIGDLADELSRDSDE